MNLLAFAASHRVGSYNKVLAALAAKIAADGGANVSMRDYAEFDAPPYDDAMHKISGLPAGAQRFAEAVAATDGIIIASPEYNWSFPGSLKNLIDWASCLKPNPFAGKTALLLSATPSMRGGASGLVQLRVPLEALETLCYPKLFTLGQAPIALQNNSLGDVALMQSLEEAVKGFVQMTQKVTNPKSPQRPINLS